MKKFVGKLFSALLVLAMVFSMISPALTVSANEETQPFKQNSQSESMMQLKAAVAEQLNVIDGGPKLHRDLEGLTGDQDVPVIIHLSEKPVALEKGISQLKGKGFSMSQENQVRGKVRAQQAKVKRELNAKKVSINTGYEFDTVLNGIAATVKADDLQTLLTVEGVTLVEPDAIVYALEEPEKSKTNPTTPIKDGQVDAMMNTSIDFLGIEKLWAEGYEGQGIKVAVLDTGIDADHPEFAEIYKGGKNFVPHTGSDYARPRADDDASETSPLDRPAHRAEFDSSGRSFYTSHGTHVAGTIAAIGANEYGIKGIAPKVDLYAYRVLGAYGSGSTSGIIAAIDYAVQQEMDIINLSLGGGANTETDASSFAINNAMMAGTIGVVATGNSGPNRGTMGTPSTSRLGIAVGNTTNPETMYNGEVNVTVGSYNLTKQIQLMATTFGQDLATQLEGEFELVAVPGLGTAADFEGIDVNGKVALISRGEIPFVDKIANAKANGAVATIIHNFAGGTNAPNASGTFLGDAFEFIPTFDMSQTDGDAIRAALNGDVGTVTFGNFSSTSTAGDEVNDSSSRGPSTPNFDIKPDVTAPGTNIMSTIPMYKSDFPDAEYDEAYARKTGTSMATPHITGIVALIKQANPDWNAFDVKVALSNTAKLLDTSKYDVFDQGAGRVDAYAAAHTSVRAYAVDTAVLDGSGAIVENLKGTVTFGPQPLKDGNVSVTKQIVVKGESGSYSVSVDVIESYGDATVTVDKPSFTLSGEEVLNVTLTASQSNAPAGSEILGYIHINGGSNEISLPFAADFGGAVATEIRDMAITETDLSFNGDGVKDSADLTFTLTGDVSTNYIELWDIMNPDGGYYGDGYIGYLHAGTSLGAGAWRLVITGEYTPWGSSTRTAIPDGLYTIDFTALSASGVIGDYVGPIVVKTTKPEITGAVADGVVTGQVTDKYIEYNAELARYGLSYDLNDKLQASYVATIDGAEVDAVEFELAQDGAFTFELPEGAESVNIVINDAAGNVGELVIEGEAGPVVTLAVDPSTLDLTTGETAQLTVTETSTPVEGEPTVKDVTAEATYVVGDESVATVANGLVKAVGEGETTITITHGEKEVTVNVTVTNAEPVVTLEVNPTELDLETGATAQLVVTETSTLAEGEPTVKDVTADATYVVADESVATVTNGLVTAVGEGSTTITITHGDNEVTVQVTVTEPVVEPGVKLVANLTDVELESGEKVQLKITEVTTRADGSTREKDVTKPSKYNVADNNVVSVKNGLITAKNAGSTTITVKNGKNELTINVTVTEAGGTDPTEPTDPTDPEPTVMLNVDQTQLNLRVGESAQLTITEETTAVDGTTTEKDVTTEATYETKNAKGVNVENGIVTANSPGNTTIIIKYNNNEVTVNVKVSKK